VTISWTKPTYTTAGLHLPEGAWYDEEAADRAVKFFGLINLVEGKGAGERWQLMPWMEYEIIRPLFGYKRADGTRVYRTVWVEVPRKNAKTTLAAGIALYGLLADNEPAAQVIMGARDRMQARVCFELARKMVEASPSLRKRCRAVRSYIEHPGSGSVLRAVSADAAGQHGLNAHIAVIDEVHVHPDRELWDVLATSVGARSQPIVFGITTAGVYDPFSIAWEQHDYTLRVASGDLVDHSFLGVIYGADKDADWKDPEIWRAANPSLGTTITEDYLKEEVVRASVSPARQTTFRQLHLGVWTSEVQRWIDPDAWKECAGEHRERNFEGPVFAGLDLSSTTDISALVLLHPYQDGTYDIEPYFWMPEEGVADRERRDRLPYRDWASKGYITLTPGNLIDYAFIEARIIELKDRYPRMSVAYDPWNATSLITRLIEQGVPAIPTRQGYATLSSPTKELERLVLAKALRHQGHPVLETHVTAALCQSDPAGNVKPSKSASNARIDGCVATIMALNSATLSGSLDTYRSVYEERGIQTI
jgi:phage terminase large subunit-like protein